MSYLIFPSGGGGTGATGAAGTDGDTIEAGASTPNTSGGPVGNRRYWLDTTTNEFYFLSANTSPSSSNWTKIADFSGPTGAAGSNGLNGIDGASGDQWTHAALNDIAPSDKLTADVFDEYQLDTDTGKVYHCAANGTTWALVANFTGPQGIQGTQGITGNVGPTGSAGASGSQWSSGTNAPSNSNGNHNDFYFKSDDRGIYKKTDIYATIAVTIPNFAVGDVVEFNYFDGTSQQTATITIGGSTVATFTAGAATIARSGSLNTDAAAIVVLINTISGYSATRNNADITITADTAGSTYNSSLDITLSGTTTSTNGVGSISWDLLATISDGPQGAQGLTGNTGNTGATGATGNTGNDGEDGSLWTSGVTDKLPSEGKLGDFHFNTLTFDLFEKREVPHISKITISNQEDGTLGVDFDANGEMLFDSFDANEKATYKRDVSPDPDYIVVFNDDDSQWELRLDDKDVDGNYQSSHFAFNPLSSSDDGYYPNPLTWLVNATNWPSISAAVGLFENTTASSQKTNWYTVVNLEVGGAAGEGVPSGGTAGQVLSKATATDFDTTWVDAGGAGTKLEGWETDTDGNLVPEADQAQNIGSPTRQLHSLYVSGKSIYIDNKKLSVDTDSNLFYQTDGGSKVLLTQANGTESKSGTANITVGIVTTGAAGTDASVSNSGNATDAVFDFTIPKGDVGPAGPQGTAGYNGSISIEASVSDASALPSSLGAGDAGKGYITQNDGALHLWDGTKFVNLGAVRGEKGDTGDTGASSTFIQGTTDPQASDGNDGDLYINTNSGDLFGPKNTTWGSAISNLKGPAGTRGTDGLKGNDGTAGQITIGTVADGSTAAVTNTGTSSVAVLDFVLPKGDKGEKGDQGNTNAVTITGNVASSADLPVDLTTGDTGNGYISNDTKELHVWVGTEFINVGGVHGPAGEDGKGWTSGAYDPSTGITSFESDDGLGFQTTDIRGSGWTSSNQAPTGGKNGDFHFNTATNKFYKKVSNVWEVITDLPKNSGTPVTAILPFALGKITGSTANSQVACTITQSSSGVYDVAFATEQANTNYTIFTDSEGISVGREKISNKTTNGFRIEHLDSSNAVINEDCSFICFGESPQTHIGTTVEENIILELTEEFGQPQAGTVINVKSLRLPYNFRITGMTAWCNAPFEDAPQVTLSNEINEDILTQNLTLPSSHLSSNTAGSSNQAVVDTSKRDIDAYSLIQVGTIWSDGKSGHGLKVVIQGIRTSF